MDRGLGRTVQQHIEQADVVAQRHARRLASNQLLETNGVGRISARTIEMLVSHPARTMRTIVDSARPYPLFVPVT